MVGRKQACVGKQHLECKLGSLGAQIRAAGGRISRMSISATFETLAAESISQYLLGN